jgi:quercetin dioxygenase-like cupin family protein
MRQITLTAALVLCVWVATAGQAMAQPSVAQPVTRMYSDVQGETHIETVMMDVGQSSGFSATGTTYFVRFATDMDLDWHPAPRRQFIITLSGPGYEIETSDGSVAQLPPGSVLLVEDTNPEHRGHQTRSLGGETLVIFVPID